MAGPGYVSWSQFDRLATCGESYRLQYHEKVPQGDKGYFIGGQAVHEAIEYAENTGYWGDATKFMADGDVTLYFQEVFAKKVASAKGVIEWGGRATKAFPNGEDAAWWLGTGGKDMLARYGSLRREDHLQGMGLPEVEVKVSMTMPSGKMVVGYIDQLFTDRSRDWKTGSTFNPGVPLQIALYEHILRAMGHEPRHIGEYVFLRARDARLVFTVDLDVWVDMVPILLGQLEARLESGLFTYSPGKHCSWCSVAAHCEIGKRLQGDDESESGNSLG